MEAFIQANCSFAILPFHLVAADGLTMKQAMSTRYATFQPGYRWDALVQFPQERANIACSTSSARRATASATCRPASRLLGIVKVEPGPGHGRPRHHSAEQLVDAGSEDDAARRPRRGHRRPQRRPEAHRFAPHDDGRATSELTGGQELTFDILTSTTPTPQFTVANQLAGSPGYNPQPYDPARLDRKLTLGTAEEWKLTSDRPAGHPFHIHVNPFEIVTIVDNANPAVDVSASGRPARRRRSAISRPQGRVEGHVVGKPGYTVTIRTRYQRYIGEFVLHCHILDHEDEGMMQNVAVVLPGGNAASVNAPPVGHSTSH